MNTKLLEQVETDYPEYRFVLGKKFAFRPSRTIVVEPESSNFEMLLLHELSHAILGHYSFDVDIERIKMESNAWEKAKELAKNYNIEMQS